MKLWLILGLFLILISLVNAKSDIKIIGDDIQLSINTEPDLKILKQTGDEQLLDFTWNKIKDTEYQIQICTKNFEKDKNKFSNLKIKTIKLKDKPVKDLLIDLSKKQCETVDLDFGIGEIVKFGDESTEIILTEDNLSIVVHPENKTCVGLKCTSEIILRNSGLTNVTLYSDDIWVNIEQGTAHLYTQQKTMRDVYDCESNPATRCEQIVGTTESYEYHVSTGQHFLITLEPNQSQTFYFEAVMDSFGQYKYDVNINYLGQNYSIDPFFDLVDSNPRTIIFSPSGEGYQIGDQVRLLGGVISNETIDTVRFQIQYPNTSIIEYIVTIPQNQLYNALTDDPDAVGTTDGLLYSFGDTSWGGNRFWNLANAISGHQTGYIDGYNSNIDLIFGNPQATGFIYNIWLCEIASDTLTQTFSLFDDCIDTPVKVSDNLNVSQFWDNTKSSVTGRKYLNFDIPYFINSSRYYALMREYVNSTDRADNSSDSWLMRIDNADASPRQPYKQILELANGTPNYNQTWPYIQDLTLFNNYTYYIDFNDTSQPGIYIVTIIANDSSGSENSTTSSYFTICTPTFTCNGYNPCNTSDLQTCNSAIDTTCGATYTGNYSEFAPQSCNYCSQSITYTETACFWNGSMYIRYRNYTDNQYYLCCAITSLPTDCDILTYPYNQTNYIVFCSGAASPLEDDFVIDIDDAVYFGLGIGGLNSDKVYGKIYLNSTNSSYCISYIKTTDMNLVQTNPPYIKRNTATIQIVNKEIEDREFFVTQQGLANVYWTDSDIVIDGRQYIFGVECSGNGNHLVSEKLVNVFYAPVNAPITRFVWVQENIMPLILGIIIIFAIAMTAFWIWRLR